MPDPNTDSPPYKEKASLHPFENEEPIQVKQFRVDDLPAGKISTLNVEIVTDALNIPITVPVIVAKGTEPGPVLGLTAALHGNELNGILVIQEFLQSVDPGALKGVIAGVPVVNVPGYLFNQREYFDGFDLNHIMPGKREGKRSEVYAYRLVNRIISQFNHLIDFHTASFGRINSHYVRANLAQVETARMARMQHTQIILHSVAPNTTLRGTCSNLGIQCITVELGTVQRFQMKLIRDSILGVENVAKSLGILEGDIIYPEESPVTCSRSTWLRSPVGGVLRVFPELNEWIESGQLIAQVRDIFGNMIKEFTASEPGIVVGKNVNPVAFSGARLLHLGFTGDEQCLTSEIDDDD